MVDSLTLLGPLAQRKSKPLIMVRSRYRNSQGPPFYTFIAQLVEHSLDKRDVAVFKVNKWSPKPPKGIRFLPAAPFKKFFQTYVSVARMIRHLTATQIYAGSNPVRHSTLL